MFSLELVKTSAAIAAVLLVQSGAALAQERDPLSPEIPSRPFRGLFEPPPRPSIGGQALIFNISAYGAYDQDLAAGVTGAGVGGVTGGGDPRSQVSGSYSGLSTGLAYEKQTRRLSLGLSESSTATYQGRAGGNRLLGYYSAAADTSAHLRRWDLSGHGGITYTPFFQVGVLLPNAVEEAANSGLSRQADYSLNARPAISSDAGATLSRELSNRTSLELTYTASRIAFVHENEQRLEQQGGLRFNRRIGRNLSARLGYGYRVSQWTAADGNRSWRGHDIDLGLGYDRALSRTRRTRLSLSTGSTLSEDTAARKAADSTRPRLYVFVLTGNAELTHEMGRTWGATAGYHRGVEFNSGFQAPFLANTASAAAGGFLGRRLHLGLSSYYSLGAVGLGTGGHGYSTLNGTGSLTVPLAGRLSVFGEYFYYRYRFDSTEGLPFGIPQHLTRQGGRVGLRLSVPLATSGNARTRENPTSPP